MGWKAVKDHYRIGHTVQIREGDLLIGSAYVSDLITVKPDGTVIPNRVFSNEGGDLGRYRDEMRADKAKLLDLMKSEDVFERGIPVYSWHDAEIVEDLCEEFGYPNITHTGALMYENTHFLDRDDAIRKALRSTRYGIESWRSNLEEAKEKIVKVQARLDEIEANFAKLRADHPAIAAEPVEED
jgi:hypothetical protein